MNCGARVVVWSSYGVETVFDCSVNQFGPCQMISEIELMYLPAWRRIETLTSEIRAGGERGDTPKAQDTSTQLICPRMQTGLDK